MTVGTGNFAELLWPGIVQIFQDQYDRFGSVYPEIFDKQESNKAFEKVQGVVGLPLAGIKEQGGDIPMVDPLQGYQKEFVNVTYALGSSVTREMFEDDQYNVINRIPEYLAESMRQTEETVAHSVINNGFSGENSADGVSIFNTAHPLASGSTLSNMGQSGVTYALSQTSLENACIFIRKWTDDQDLKINAKGLTLIVPPDLQYTAEKILNTEYEVGTANNTINPVRGKMKLVVSNWLTDTDAWFIKTDQAKKSGLVFMDRRARDIQRDSDFNTQNFLFSTSRRFSVGCADWRCIWGSSGA